MTQTTMAGDTRALISRFYAAGMAGDVETFFACLDPDVEVHEPSYLPYGGVYRGVEGFQRLFAAASAVVDIPNLEIENLIADGNRASVVLRTRLVATGEPLIITEEWAVRDGLVVFGRISWYDPSPLLARSPA